MTLQACMRMHMGPGGLRCADREAAPAHAYVDDRVGLSLALHHRMLTAVSSPWYRPTLKAFSVMTTMARPPTVLVRPWKTASSLPTVLQLHHRHAFGYGAIYGTALR